MLDAKEKGTPGELKMDPAMVRAVCDRAHELGFTVAAHVESTEGVRVALEGGVDSIEHGAAPTDEIMGLFKKNGSFLCATISPALPYALFDRSVSCASEVEQYNGNMVFEGIIANSKAALEQGVPVALGNDVGCPWITQYNSGVSSATLRSTSAFLAPSRSTRRRCAMPSSPVSATSPARLRWGRTPT